MREIETIGFKKSVIEIREKAPTNKDEKPYHVIMGMIPYNSRTDDMGGWFEKLSPGCFKKSVKEHDVKCLYSHDTSKVLGRSRNNTLTLNDTPDGLEFSCILPNTTYANDVIELVRSGYCNGVSFGFAVVQDTWDTENNPPVRTVNEAMLYEISVSVAFPAYPNADSNIVRSLCVQNNIDYNKLIEGLQNKKVRFEEAKAVEDTSAPVGLSLRDRTTESKTIEFEKEKAVEDTFTLTELYSELLKRY